MRPLRSTAVRLEPTSRRLVTMSDLTLKVVGRIAGEASGDVRIDRNVRMILRTASAALAHDVAGTLRGMFHGFGF